MTEGIGGFLEKAEGLAREHPDQAREALDKAGQMLNEQTGGAHGDQVARGEKLLDERLGIQEQTPGQ